MNKTESPRGLLFIAGKIYGIKNTKVSNGGYAMNLNEIKRKIFNASYINIALREYLSLKV